MLVWHVCVFVGVCVHMLAMRRHVCVMLYENACGVCQCGAHGRQGVATLRVSGFTGRIDAEAEVTVLWPPDEES